MPSSPNGIISGYRLYYMSKQVTDVVTVKDSSKEIIYRLQNLGNNTSMQELRSFKLTLYIKEPT